MSQIEPDNKSCVNHSNLLSIAPDSIPPYPVYYNNQIIISLCVSDPHPPGLYSYDIHNNTYNEIADYPDNLVPDEHGLAIDKIHHELYIFSGTQKGTFAIYNLITKQWEIVQHSNMLPTEYPQSFYIPAPVDDLYYIGGKNDQLFGMKYSRNTKTFTSIMDTFPIALIDAEMIFDEQRQNIMLFGGMIQKKDSISNLSTIYMDNIWYYEINANDGLWTDYNLKLPIATDRQIRYKVVYAFGSIVFLLCLSKVDNIYCLELNSQKWYKSHLSMPMGRGDFDVVKTDDNYIHMIGYYEKWHSRLNLYDLIPPELFDFLGKYYSNIIFGYVRIYIEQEFHVYISNDLKYLISKYYDCLSGT